MDKLNQGLDKILEAVQLEMAKVLIEQGHKNTGELIMSLERKVGISEGIILMNKYGIFIDKGVKPGRIPYRRGSGAGTSKYIQGLIAFVKQRGIATGDKQARQIAFAIANVQKQEGMPTNRSRRFSRSGKRTGFIDEALKRADKRIEEETGRALANEVEVILDPLEKNSNIV